MGVVLGAIAWLAAALPGVWGQLADPVVWIFILIVLMVDLIPVPAWGGMQLTLSFPILLAVAIVFPPPVAGLVALLGSIDPRETKLQVSLIKALANRSQMALSIMAAAMVFQAVASLDSRWFRLVPAVLLATIVAYSSNTLIVAVHGALTYRMPVHTVLAKMHGARPYEFLLSYLGLGLFGVVIARLYDIEGIWPVIVFLAPLIFARQMYFRSRGLADQLSEQNALLEQQAERLEQLLRKEHETVDELRELNRMKGEFVAVVSHELRTPVTALIGYSKTLQQPEFSDDQSLRDEFLSRMERQGDRLLRLVENLLTTSRLENRELPVTVGRVLFEDVCREVIEGLGAEAERIRVAVPTDLPVLSTDRQLLGRIVSNLIDNALKYSTEGEMCELGARAEGDAIVFWVSDQGIGIPREQVERIFDRFYQVDSSSTRSFAGAGLGLSLVSDLLGHLGGAIDVTSEEGAGSTFTVRLPVRYRPDGDEEHSAASSHAADN